MCSKYIEGGDEASDSTVGCLTADNVFLLLILRDNEREGGRETVICCFSYLHIHWLILAWDLPRD